MVAIDEVKIKELIEKALMVKDKAYAPYSKFKVGAALLSESGEIFLGCNVENASYGLTNCAERTALFRAVADGNSKFRAIAIVADTEELCSPCGACRQVLAEFGPEIKVIMANSKGEYKVKTVNELLPGAFTGKQIPYLEETDDDK